MDYLLSYRYKLLNSLQVHMTGALASKECGNSQKFHSSLKNVRLWTKNLTTLSSDPFTSEELDILRDLDEKILLFIDFLIEFLSLGKVFLSVKILLNLLKFGSK